MTTRNFAHTHTHRQRYRKRYTEMQPQTTLTCRYTQSQTHIHTHTPSHTHHGDTQTGWHTPSYTPCLNESFTEISGSNINDMFGRLLSIQGSCWRYYSTIRIHMEQFVRVSTYDRVHEWVQTDAFHFAWIRIRYVKDVAGDDNSDRFWGNQFWQSLYFWAWRMERR